MDERIAAALKAAYRDGAAVERAAILAMLREEAASIAAELPAEGVPDEKPTIVWSWAMARAYRRICALADAIETRTREKIP